MPPEITPNKGNVVLEDYEEATPLTTPPGEQQEQFNDEIPAHLEPYLQTPPTQGLSEDQVADRQERFGRNEFKEKKRNKLLHFLSFFTGPISYLMEVSVILTAVTQDWVDFGIILGLLIANAVIGYIEEARADSAVEALKSSLALTSRCYRSGRLIEVNSSELVVGDILALRLGDIVPADARLLGLDSTGAPAQTDLNVDQSALTGESLPVKKRQGDLVYSSSVIKQGQQLAIVVRTGPDTFIGRAANLINVATAPGHFQKVINYIGNFLIIITLVLVCVLFIYDLVELRILNGSVSGADVLDTLKECVVITIAAIPVGLPTVMSVTMAVGAKELAKRQVIIKRLTAVEELSAVSILCTDKTGTLTLNELTFDEPYVSQGYSKDDVLLYAYLASESNAQDPIEIAIRSAAEKLHPNVDSVQGVLGYTASEFNPFNPVDKMSFATVQELGTRETYKVAKGAPQVIMELLNRGGDAQAEEAVNAFAHRGLRSLGVARTREGSDRWELVGLMTLIDPPRPDSASTLSECQHYGLSVKMITGDQATIAQEVSVRLGMGTLILDADHLVDPSKSDNDVTDDCLRADGFARVIPEHKYRVVELLQNRGYFVAMTGDGVNDAAALKKANVGIAVHGSTDAARSASDIVLLSPGLSPIIEGIKMSRIIFQRLRSYALYRITSTIHFLLFIFIVTIAEDWQMPPILLILVSVLNDAATLIMALDNVQISPLPEFWRLGRLVFLSCMLAIFLSLFSFAHFYIFRDVLDVTAPELSTIMYLHISSAPHFVIFSTRLETFCWRNIPAWPFTVVVLGTQVIALILSVYGFFGYDENIGSIGWPRGMIILAISLVTFLLLDIVKVLMIFVWDNGGGGPSILPWRKHKLGSRAKEFQKRHELHSRAGYDRALRRESVSSVRSF
ncbi:plasma-membrane proton-efflux P-type ATPase [Zychaea mexicana]|uniref:plasma-membrane proton-efflux P-type ATPase n=1 Tax=Zychaea mexicana TaxID=64656 RepID=UPI0022FE54B8|nr:plasma-membrane proton-efflux P-type ATPase [Zychaea mexicana]KAI9488988.1 plasma-membrane proton-efflux P-type ATPase [Zychaea mexicana]